MPIHGPRATDHVHPSQSTLLPTPPDHLMRQFFCSCGGQGQLQQQGFQAVCPGLLTPQNLRISGAADEALWQVASGMSCGKNEAPSGTGHLGHLWWIMQLTH